MTRPRLRFAPSPTGTLHLGGARTALYNWAAARALGGTFVLRIEDTDRQRSKAEYLEVILAGLRWLGIDWDEGPDMGGDHGPYFQSQRHERYRAAALALLASGHAYQCYCTPEQVDAGRERLRAAQQRPMYDRRCRELTADQRQAFEDRGRSHAIRFKTPLTGSYQVEDIIRSRSTVQLEEFDDFMVLRHDGTPLYNFACVVDDLDMEITHVARGEEHFLNGIKQRLLYDALGATPPQFAHIPLILNRDGKKLSKRDMDTNMLDYRDRGYPADAVFNYIALLGWGFSGDRDVFTRAEMIERFRLEKVGKAGARFDEEKLLWMCGDYVRRMGRAELVAAVRPFLVADGFPEQALSSHGKWVANLVCCFRERMRVYSELPNKVRFGWQRVECDEQAQKNLEKRPQAREWLLGYGELLAGSRLVPSYPEDRGGADGEGGVELPSVRDGEVPEPGAVEWLWPQHLETQAREYGERVGAKFGHFVHPVRAALTGTNAGPGLFDCVWLLGKEECVARLRAAAAGLGG